MPSILQRLFRRTAETEPPKGGEDYPELPRTTPIATPRSLSGPQEWSLEDIRTARNQQMAGQFERPVRLAEAFRYDDALFNAYHARVDTQGSLRLRWQAAATPAGARAKDLANGLIEIPAQVRKSILGTMANHGIAIGFVRTMADGDNARSVLTEWPLEHVYWLRASRQLMTRVYSAQPTEIKHGDGTWIVFSKYAAQPWTQDAAVLPGAMIYAARGTSLLSWQQAAHSHGEPKLIGELPPGIKIGKDGALSPEGQALLDMLSELNSGTASAGLRPSGSKTEVLVSNDQSWQIFRELVLNRERAAARVYLGTDAILGSPGGAPGVDISMLFSVASTRIQGDLEALERGYREGLILPWCALHGFTPADAPIAEYEVPDPDADRKAEQTALAIDRFAASIKALKEVGVQTGQDVVSALADILQVQVPVVLAADNDRSVPLPLAPTDIAKVVSVNEARASNGLPAFPGERGSQTIAELDAAAKAAAAPAPAAPGAGPPDPAGSAPEGA